jgi:hypothetical protein
MVLHCVPPSIESMCRLMLCCLLFPFLSYDNLMRLPFLFAKEQGTNLNLNPILWGVSNKLTFEDLHDSLCTTYMYYTQSMWVLTQSYNSQSFLFMNSKVCLVIHPSYLNYGDSNNIESLVYIKIRSNIAMALHKCLQSFSWQTETNLSHANSLQKIKAQISVSTSQPSQLSAVSLNFTLDGLRGLGIHGVYINSSVAEVKIH